MIKKQIETIPRLSLPALVHRVVKSRRAPRNRIDDVISEAVRHTLDALVKFEPKEWTAFLEKHAKRQFWGRYRGPRRAAFHDAVAQPENWPEGSDEDAG